MLLHMALSYGLGGAFLWWMMADMSPPAAILGGVLLPGAIVGLFLLMWRRSRRLRSEWEGHAPRLITHAGAGQSRWDRRKRGRMAPLSAPPMGMVLGGRDP